MKKNVYLCIRLYSRETTLINSFFDWNTKPYKKEN